MGFRSLQMASAFPDMASNPCRVCGGTDRHKSGRCTFCQRKAALTWWKRHPQARVDCAARRTARVALLAKCRDKPCADCGNRFPTCAMDFDHVRGEKSFTVSSQPGATMKRLLAEIAKCDVVCAVCHRIRTWNRSHNWVEQV